ncbi:hypothetical protein ILUMI_24075 [Ignelater luminosus]|uniref:Uncharacterized protein n=1 Tax=Ignelater luminosus TaxID=2038154 RepID=A0A8K0FZ24_IGNLU|nr:hypothetical protein ILUMI_24075 [Ignelater luminosus]
MDADTRTKKKNAGKENKEPEKDCGTKTDRQKNALLWFGQLMIMDPRRLTRRIWKMGRPKKGGRGRPRQKWDDDIGKYLDSTKLTWNKAATQTRDRVNWRRRIADTRNVETT